MSISEILAQLQIDDYYRALSISKDELELHLKSKPNFCFVNNYFNDGLNVWQANMYIQLFLDQCSQAMKEAVKEVFENNLHCYETISQVYLSKPQCSIQKAIYHILPGLKLRRVFPAVHLVNTNLLELKTQILLSEKELNKLPGDNTNIFKKWNIG